MAFSLISSLFVAIFLIPMMYYRYYRNKKAPVKLKSVKVGGYGRFLEKLLKIKWPVIIATLLLVGGSFLLVPFIGTEFYAPN